jgi:hypothetical protein
MFYENTAKTILKWEMSGILFLIIFGSLLHFTYEWSNFNPIVGIFSPVNESVWEHLKMGFFASLVFSIIEYSFIGSKVHNFIPAKALGIVALELIIVVVFYLYTAVTGSSILFVDISLYVIGSIVCQIISYNMLIRDEFKPLIQYVNAGILLALGISFIVFTFYTPKLPVFKDGRFNSYGTDWKTLE